jgi:hypothetical protein
MQRLGGARLCHFTVSAIGLAVLVACATLALCLPRAQGSVPGDEDATFGAQGGVFSPVSPDSPQAPAFAEQDSDGTIVVAEQVKLPQPANSYPIDLFRYTASGAPTGFVNDTGRAQTAPPLSTPNGLKDLKIIHDEGGADDGQIVMAVNSPTHGGYYQSVSKDGADPVQQDSIAPPTCANAQMRAARVESATTIVAGFDCTDGSIVVRWTKGTPSARAIGDLSSVVDGIQDVEFGPGTIYVLGKDPDTAGASVVVRLKPLDDGLTLEPDDTYGTDGVVHLPGNPVDMVVDTDGRAYAWTKAVGSAATTWDIYRRTSAGDPDPTWGSPTGRARVTNTRLTSAVEPAKLMIGAGGQLYAEGIANASHITPLALLTGAGALDPTWGSGGVKQLTFTGSGTAGNFYEPVIQDDGKVLVPYDVQAPLTMSRSLGGAPAGFSIGLARLQLVGNETFSDDFAGFSNQSGANGGSTGPTTCGRRSISLVRAFSRGGKVELQGLVGSAFYGEKVTVYASTGHGYHKVKSTTATRIGTFATRVRRPRGRRFAKTRYVAKASTARSPALKLPQSLKSTSIKQRNGRITVRGTIKRGLVGHRRRAVKIQRLVCGHYKTVGSARPTRRGRYRVTFDAPRLSGVAYFRARGVVLNKTRRGHYVVQYARAVRIRLTGQTG